MPIDGRGPASNPQPGTAKVEAVRPQQAVRPIAPPQRVMPSSPGPLPPMKAAGVAPRIAPPGPQPQIPMIGGWGGAIVNVSAAPQEISSEASSLQSALDDLRNRSSFNDVISAINGLDSQITKVLELLESARQEGYCYQNDLENLVNQAKSQWDSTRPRLFSDFQQQSIAMQNRLPALAPMIQQVNANIANPIMARSLIQSAHSQVNTLLESVNQIQRSLENGYSGLQSQMQQTEKRLNDIHWAMDQLAGACYKLENGESLVMAISARWDKEGKEDPEGVLYLTNQRLVFERKEKVATKKILFITTASELVQEVLINQPLSNVRSVKAENKGLFGNQDFINAQFADAKLGAVALHIKGQDSKVWAGLIERSRSGQIDAERITGGEVSVADLTEPLTTASVAAVQNEVGILQDDMMLKPARQELAEIENDVVSMGRKLMPLRGRGYVIEKNLEGDISILATQWDRIKAIADKTIENQANLLSSQMQSIQQMASQLMGMAGNLAAARPLYLQLKSAMASAKTQSQAAYETVAGTYRLYNTEVDTLSAHLDWIGWMQDALETASFRLLATECGIAAAEAMWGQPDIEAENGVLFLTDQRLLWEDRVGTYELKVNIPLQQVSDVRKDTAASQDDQGREALLFAFAPGAPLQSASFQLSLPVADDWLKMIGRARSGSYAQDRVVEVDQAELEKVRNAPQQCPKCGAVFSAPILRGQTEIKCEYCGLAVRL